MAPVCRSSMPIVRIAFCDRNRIRASRCGIPHPSPSGISRWGSYSCAPSLTFGHSGCLETFRSVHDLEFDFLPFVERLKAFALDDRKMHEDVFPTRLFDETVAFPIIKPLDLP